MKQILDKTRKNDDFKKDIVFIKKIDANIIPTILTNIPMDVCSIITTYINEEICMHCEIISRTHDYAIYVHENDVNIFTITVEYYPILTINDIQNVVNIYNSIEIAQDDVYMLNTYMENVYSKPYYFVDTDPEVQITYIQHHPLLHDSIIMINNDKETVSMMQILNHKKFKLILVMIKCIMRGIDKYNSRKKIDE